MPEPDPNLNPFGLENGFPIGSVKLPNLNFSNLYQAFGLGLKNLSLSEPPPFMKEGADFKAQ